MSRIEIDELKELFAEWGLWSLVDDISPDGDGHGDNLELTREGLEAKRMIDQLLEGEYQRGVKEGTKGKFYEKVELITQIPKEIVDQLLSERIREAKKETLQTLRDELLEQVRIGRKYNNIYGGVASYQDALHIVGNMLSKLLKEQNEDN